MERTEFIIKFEGELADLHKLPAYEAAQSITGIAKSVIIPTNYLFEGKVRRKRFEDITFRLNIVAQRPGSFETVMELLFDPKVATLATGLGVGISANFISDFVGSLISRVIGGPASDRIEGLEKEGRLKAGDLAALVDAIQPSVKQSHITIDAGANSINIIGDNNTVNFDSASKRYVSKNIKNDDIRVRLFSVASMNSNTGYGRVYDNEEGRTIPFQLPKGIDGESVAVLLTSFSKYARRRWMGNDEDSLVAIRYTTYESEDGKAKKIIPIAARNDINEF